MLGVRGTVNRGSNWRGLNRRRTGPGGGSVVVVSVAGRGVAVDSRRRPVPTVKGTTPNVQTPTSSDLTSSSSSVLSGSRFDLSLFSVECPSYPTRDQDKPDPTP